MNPATVETIEAYISSFPPDIEDRLRRVLKILRTAAPDAKEAIKYGMPTLVLGENLIHFAAHDRHIGLYPTPSGITAFKDQLASYSHSKGAIQLPHNSPLPTDLIRAIVEFRVREVRAKLEKPKSPPLATTSTSSKRSPKKAARSKNT